MTITQNYRNAFAEVYNILQYVEDEDYKKIPTEVISAIEENMNIEYEYDIDEQLDIYDQKMLPETKAILFNFYRDYWASSEEKSKIVAMQNEERLKLDKEKSRKYNPDNIFKDKIQQEHSAEQETAIIEAKEDNIFKKIKSFLSKLLHRSK